MLKTLMLTVLVATVAAASPTAFAASSSIKRYHGAPPYVPGQIFNYNTIALRHWGACWCPVRSHFRAPYAGW